MEIGGLIGFALNLDDGRVQIVAEGRRENCHRLLDWLRSDDTPGRWTGH
ncbi:acylphosphatase [Streptomyces badius]